MIQLMSSFLASLTEFETKNFGDFFFLAVLTSQLAVFLNELWKTLLAWYHDAKLYRSQCLGNGRLFLHRQQNQVVMAYETYCRLLTVWMRYVNKFMIECLDSGETVQIRNALIFLNDILPWFPVISEHAEAIDRAIDRLLLDEARKDIKTLAVS